jgi:hypothetical protein
MTWLVYHVLIVSLFWMKNTASFGRSVAPVTDSLYSLQMRLSNAVGANSTASAAIRFLYDIQILEKF